MRIPSSEVFQINPSGTITVIKPIRIGGVFLNNVEFSRGVKVGNLDLTSLVGNDLEAQLENGAYVITGYYERA